VRNFSNIVSMGLAINKIGVEKLFEEMFERDVTVEWRELLFFFL